MKDKANKGYWQRLAKIYAPLMESDNGKDSCPVPQANSNTFISDLR